jgi:L-ascorbate metabolism protein UlaG (beta-lactamase superfamily)
MRITKLGHCALVLELEAPAGGVLRIFTDPGSFTIEQNVQTNIDVVLITHEHGDHLHVESLKKIVETNPKAVVVTNQAVAAILQKEGITTTVTVVGDGESMEINGVRIEGCGTLHEEIYKELGQVENTGYMIGEKFYYPGDAFHAPGKPVDILALPVAGPWARVRDTVRFAEEVKARIAFGVHDGMIVPAARSGTLLKALEKFVPETQYVTLQDGETREF